MKLPNPKNIWYNLCKEVGEWLLYTYCECKGISYITDDDKLIMKAAPRGTLVQLKPWGKPVVTKMCKEDDEIDDAPLGAGVAEDE